MQENAIRYITDLDEAWELWHEIEGKELAIDIEAEFNCHVYGEHLALIQLAWDEGNAIIDPLGSQGKRLIARDPSFEQLSEHRVTVSFSPEDEVLCTEPWIAWLHAFFGSPGTPRIVFGAQSDATLLYYRYGVAFEDRIDLASALGLLEFEKRGLESVLMQTLGVAPKNKNKFQRYNWLRRPIDRDALSYAIGDVTSLFALRDLLFGELEAKQLMEAYWEQNALDAKVGKKEYRRWLKAKGYKHLPKHAQKKFMRLFIVRDAMARILDRPPHQVVANQVLLSLAKQGKRTPDAAKRMLRGAIPAELVASWVDACTR